MFFSSCEIPVTVQACSLNFAAVHLDDSIQPSFCIPLGASQYPVAIGLAE
jgi:hypothetical protein